jgi:hypothetical protein
MLEETGGGVDIRKGIWSFDDEKDAKRWRMLVPRYCKARSCFKNYSQEIICMHYYSTHRQTSRNWESSPVRDHIQYHET